MGDWEDDDWEAAKPSFKPAAAVVAKTPAENETKGAAILAKVNEPDMAKFADEDQGEPEEPKHVVVQSQVKTTCHAHPIGAQATARTSRGSTLPYLGTEFKNIRFYVQPKKKEEKKWMKAEVEEDTPLDDPLAEKLRRQRQAHGRPSNQGNLGLQHAMSNHANDALPCRLVEQADLAAAKELFGDTPGINLDLYLPKSVKDFEEYATAIVNKYVACHKDNRNFKVRQHTGGLATWGACPMGLVDVLMI